MKPKIEKKKSTFSFFHPFWFLSLYILSLYSYVFSFSKFIVLLVHHIFRIILFLFLQEFIFLYFIMFLCFLFVFHGCFFLFIFNIYSFIYCSSLIFFGFIFVYIFLILHIPPFSSLSVYLWFLMQFWNDFGECQGFSALSTFIYKF